MINPTLGKIEFPAVDVPVGPSLTRDSFLQHSTKHAVLIKNEPWYSYSLPLQPLGGASFGVTLCFHGEAITCVKLGHHSPVYGVSWSDWSKDKELKRKAFHDTWLKRNGFDRATYEWGTLYSDFDSKSGVSVIVLRYR